MAGTWLVLVLPATHLGAQEGAQPTVFLALYGGVASGQSLWQVNQPLCVWQTVPGGYQCGPTSDTLALSRRVTAGFSAGVGIAKFFDPHFGGRLDLWYVQESIQDRCSAPSEFQADADQKNEQTCTNFSADAASLDLIGVAASALLRPFPTSSLSPYLRVGTGIVIPTAETLAASGEFVANGNTLSRQMITDSSGEGPRPYLLLAAGLQTGVGTSSRFQLELSDAIVPIDRITSAANANGQASHLRSMTHNVSLTLGLALVFNGIRGRRY
ncbi:MAG TPA: hypothetical protein VEV39_12080 [Gemmatimonadales bacterium]|nr:hypothetical protein [Gemmatimonadales bacterium]